MVNKKHKQTQHQMVNILRLSGEKSSWRGGRATGPNKDIRGIQRNQIFRRMIDIVSSSININCLIANKSTGGESVY
jgi:hypothetical protein